MSSRLRAAERWVGPLAGALVPADPPRSPEGKLQVYVDCSPLGAEQLAALEQAGVTIDGVDTDRGRVRGSIDPAALDQVAEFSWVRAVRPVDRAVVRAGSATTEGDAAARADLVRAQGLDGSGVVVGVISDGIDNLREAQQSGDLPDVAVPNDGRCPRGSGDEGTALLEIVHDVAPGAGSNQTKHNLETSFPLGSQGAPYMVSYAVATACQLCLYPASLPTMGTRTPSFSPVSLGEIKQYAVRGSLQIARLTAATSGR